MASHPPAACCVQGVKHEGETFGKLEKVDNVEYYVTYPEDKKTDKAILIFPDVMGHNVDNAKLIADQFAANGYFVVSVDQFDGDALPLNRPGDFDFMKWREGHTTEKGDKIAATILKELKEKYGAKTIGAVGYCWGAKNVIRNLKKGVIDAGYVAHPSFVDADELRGIEGPLSIAAAETDAIFPAEKRHESEKILQELKATYQINLYSGVSHGFSVRGDLSNPVIKYAKEQAFLQAVFWFDEHIKNKKA
ncbi:dienelactone hydrolase family protein [Microthyrium microscopicum]|uniref:Dienelactone hydrolase family protein n=1 Tax=Microthyrium microscopicum TaxID=703497 RepID=A0A6A6TYU1_9PEZI|nr:dienelactone hydrolase family protein [Microthyrium microscopicum]